VKWNSDKDTRDPDSDFSPNVLNTVVFLVTSSTTLATFAANYKGHPFMQNLRENTAFFRCLCVCVVGVFACTLEFSPDFNELLELAKLPDVAFQHQLALIMLIDFVLSISYEAFLQYVFLRWSRIPID
jgi:cation-transporting ATPase 13A1